MANDLAPGFIKLHYASALAEHIMTIGVNPYQAVGGAWFLVEKSDAIGQAWATAVSAFLAVMKAEAPPTVTFTFGELFTKAVGSAPVFVDTAAFNVIGTGGVIVSASQINFGYRDSVGGHGKIVLCDQSNAVNQKFRGPAYGNATNLAVVNYLIGGSSFVYSRKGGFPINVPQILTKTNDVLRKKYGIS